MQDTTQYTTLYKRYTPEVKIGKVTIGKGNPIAIQSMTDTITSDIQSTTKQIIELYNAGAEIIRITVNDKAAAEAIPYIKEILDKKGYTDIPLVGCFHYNGHELIPICGKFLDKARINPGNIGSKSNRDMRFEKMIQFLITHNLPVRIGVNWGSLDKYLLTELMDLNASNQVPQSDQDVLIEAIVASALNSANKAYELGMPKNQIVISAKVSKVQDLIKVYEKLATRSHNMYVLHLGLTEAGMGDSGIISTACALAILLQKGIGDTIRASITPRINEARYKEVLICKDILQSLGLRNFNPVVTSCPGCGRTNSNYFRTLTEEIKSHIDHAISRWIILYPEVVDLKIAVMGCVVNGPGESKHSDIGISLPGAGEEPAAAVFVDGIKKCILRGNNVKITSDFKQIIDDYVQVRFGEKNK